MILYDRGASPNGPSSPPGEELTTKKGAHGVRELWATYSPAICSLTAAASVSGRASAQ